MKKLMIVAAMAITAAGFTACGNQTPKASLKTDVDSMSYAIGMSQTQGLKEYLVNQLGVDTAYIGEFIKGLNDGASAGDSKKKAAYYAGVQIGQQINNQIMKGLNRGLYQDRLSEELHGWLHQRYHRQEGSDDHGLCPGYWSASPPEHQG